MTISEVKARNHAAGRHFFDRATMRGFSSRTARAVCQLPDGGALFVTSERFTDGRGVPSPRKWTVREMTPEGEIYTARGFTFQQFHSASAALAAMRAEARARAAVLFALYLWAVSLGLPKR